MTTTAAPRTFEKAGFAFARVVGTIEDWIGVVFVAAVTISETFVLVSLAFKWRTEPPPYRFTFVVGSIAWLFLDLWYTARLLHIAIRHRRPFALTAASERRVWPMLLRPIAVIWWLSHFTIGALCAMTLHFLSRNNPGQDSPATDVLMAVGFGFAANGFLMLAVCAATRSARARTIVWQFRALIDIAMAFSGVLLSHFLSQSM